MCTVPLDIMFTGVLMLSSKYLLGLIKIVFFVMFFFCIESKGDYWWKINFKDSR